MNGQPRTTLPNSPEHRRRLFANSFSDLKLNCFGFSADIYLTSRGEIFVGERNNRGPFV